MGCGRGELPALRVDATQLREERWVIADMMGKAGHMGTVPIPAWVKAAIDEWKEACGITEAAIFRSINRTGRVCGNGMTAKMLWEVVRNAASKAGIARLAPHDLRRTCARLCHLAGGERCRTPSMIGLALNQMSTADRERVGVRQLATWRQSGSYRQGRSSAGGRCLFLSKSHHRVHAHCPSGRNEGSQ